MTDASTAPVAAAGDSKNPDVFLSKVLQKLLSEKEVCHAVLVLTSMAVFVWYGIRVLGGLGMCWPVARLVPCVPVMACPC